MDASKEEKIPDAYLNFLRGFEYDPPADCVAMVARSSRDCQGGEELGVDTKEMRSQNLLDDLL